MKASRFAMFVVLSAMTLVGLVDARGYIPEAFWQSFYDVPLIYGGRVVGGERAEKCEDCDVEFLWVFRVDHRIAGPDLETLRIHVPRPFYEGADFSRLLETTVESGRYVVLLKQSEECPVRHYSFPEIYPPGMIVAAMPAGHRPVYDDEGGDGVDRHHRFEQEFFSAIQSETTLTRLFWLVIGKYDWPKSTSCQKVVSELDIQSLRAEPWHMPSPGDGSD